MSERAVRRRDQRRVHRAADSVYTACAMRITTLWLTDDVSLAAPGDRCRRCWPTTSDPEAD